MKTTMNVSKIYNKRDDEYVTTTDGRHTWMVPENAKAALRNHLLVMRKWFKGIKYNISDYEIHVFKLEEPIEIHEVKLLIST